MIGLFSGGLIASADTDDEEDNCTYGNVVITADVGKDRVVEVTESYTVGFENGATYLRRELMRIYSNTRIRNGKKASGNKFMARYYDISAQIDSGEAKVGHGNSGDYYYISIRKPDGSAFKNGSEKMHRFKLTYKCDLSDETGEFVFPFFNQKSFKQYKGSKIYLRLKMPEEFDAEKACVVTNNNKVWSPDKELEEDYKQYGNTIYVTSSIMSANYFKLQIAVDEGYFNSGVTYYWYYWVFFGIVCALAVAAAVITFIFRARKPLIVTEFTPPEINPLHFSAFWHGYARRRDVCTVILQWAHIGCVKIVKDDKDIILIKLKNLPGDRTLAEAKYFNTLFAGGNEFSSRRLKTDKRQAERLASAAGLMLDEAKSPVTYANGVQTAKLAVLSLAAVGLFIAMSYFGWIADALTLVVVGYSLLAAIMIPLWIILVQHKDRARELRRKKNGQFFAMMLAFGASIATFGTVMIANMLPIFMPVYDYAYLLLIAFAWLVVCALLLPKLIAKRTAESQAFYGRMLGFKRFLSMAELPRIEALVDKNPEYYYEILPYCMIMGLSKKLDKKFAFLRASAPEWAEGFSATGFAYSVFDALKRNVKIKKPDKSEREL